jgi:hypothetical protein
MAVSATEDPHPLVKKVLDSKPPMPELIGFEVEQIGRGQNLA